MRQDYFHRMRIMAQSLDDFERRNAAAFRRARSSSLGDLQSAARRMRRSAAFRSRRAQGGRHVSGHGDGGFTVVELLIAFMVLAMAVGSLFQMFFVAARNNSDAAALDAANSLLSEAAERFKADPAGFGGGQPDGWLDAGGGVFVEYFDGGFGAPPGREDAVFALAASVSRSDVMLDSDLDHLRGAAEIALGFDQDHRVVVKSGPAGIEVLLDGMPQAVDGRRVGRAVPISVEFQGGGFLPKRIVAANSCGLPVVFNVFGLPSASDPAAYLSVEASDGEVSAVFYGDGAKPPRSARFDFAAVFLRLGGGASEGGGGVAGGGGGGVAGGGGDGVAGGGFGDGREGNRAALDSWVDGEFAGRVQIARIETSKYEPDS